MPNWCNNTVEVYHKDPAKLQAFVDAVNEGKMCDFILPVPEDLKIVAGSVGDPVEQAELERKTAENHEKYGAGNWYDFCVSRWGTKWDVEPYDKVEFDAGGVSFGFDSAWAPPCGIYDAMVEQGFEVRAMYYEPGMNFAGVWDNGSDDYYEIPSTSEACREELPAELDEAFGISENMQMWEEENQEEEEENDTK